MFFMLLVNENMIYVLFFLNKKSSPYSDSIYMRKAVDTYKEISCIYKKSIFHFKCTMKTRQYLSGRLCYVHILALFESSFDSFSD